MFITNKNFRLLHIILLFITIYTAKAYCKAPGTTDSIPDIYKFKYKKIILPAALISSGIAFHSIDKLNTISKKTSNYVNKYPPKKQSFDNYTEYALLPVSYVLNTFGIKGENNIVDQSIILFTSTATTYIIVKSLKKFVYEKRPYSQKANSFPSGHTAISFAGAEFLRLQYKNVSPWIGISAYGLATYTASMRVYNSRHWIHDVFAGAGIGLLSTQFAYYVFPYIHGKIFVNSKFKKATAVPFINNNTAGLYFCMSF